LLNTKSITFQKREHKEKCQKNAEHAEEQARTYPNTESTYADIALEKTHLKSDSKNIHEEIKMTLNDPLANVLSFINNQERLGRRELTTKNNSKMIREVLKIFQDEQYLGSFETQEDVYNSLQINLLGKINKCNVITPRFKVQMKDYEKYEKKFLPALGMGFLIVSTNKGLMTNIKAKEMNLGGTLICYVY
jgi:small subunit ribosomal protein S8